MTNLPKPLAFLPRLLDTIGGSGVVAGSFAAYCISDNFRGLPNDIDIFTPRPAWVLNLLESVYDVKAHVTKLNTYHLGGVPFPVQISQLNKPYTHAELIDRFDFTITQAAIYGYSESKDSSNEIDLTVETADNFHVDMLRGYLNFTPFGIAYLVNPFKTFRRVLKYNARGYYITSETIQTLMEKTAVHTPEDLKFLDHYEWLLFGDDKAV